MQHTILNLVLNNKLKQNNLKKNAICNLSCNSGPIILSSQTSHLHCDSCRMWMFFTDNAHQFYCEDTMAEHETVNQCVYSISQSTITKSVNQLLHLHKAISLSHNGLHTYTKLPSWATEQRLLFIFISLSHWVWAKIVPSIIDLSFVYFRPGTYLMASAMHRRSKSH